MAMFAPIPMPTGANEVFKDVMDYYEQLQNRRMKQPLISAQTKEATSKANQAQMLADLMNKARQEGGNAPGQISGTSGQGGSATEMLYRLGVLKPTPQEVANIQANVKAKEQLQKETQESAFAQLPLNASFTALDKILKDPEYIANAGTLTSTLMNAKPYGVPVGSMLQKNLPKFFPASVAQKLSSAQVHMGNIVVGVGQKFKGPMKQLTANYIDSMKPTPLDSPAIQQSKVTQLKVLSDLADRQNERIDELSRQGLDPTQAIIQSTKELMPEFNNMVGESISGQQGQQQQTPSAPIAQPPLPDQNYSPDKLMNQAVSSGEGIANVSPTPQSPVVSNPSKITVTNKEIQALAKRKGRSVPVIIKLLLKKGYKLEGMKNEK